MTDGDDDDDEATRDGDLGEDPDEDKTRAGSPEDIALEKAADAIGRAGRVIEENLRLVRTIPSDRREGLIRACSILLGELGDLCHETRRGIIRMKGFYLF